MTRQPQQDVQDELEYLEQHNPEHLLSGYSRTNLWGSLFIAIVLHAVIILGTSVGYIVSLATGETEPTVEEQQDAAEDAAVEDPTEGDADAAGAEPAESDGAEEPTDQQVDEDKALDLQDVPEDRRDNEVIENLRAKEDPIGINDIEIDLDETN
jgi:hypothetical protein